MIGIDSLQVNDNLPRRGTTYLKNQRPLQAKSTTYAPHPTPNCRRSVKTWFAQQLARVSRKSPVADAIRYAQHHWEGLTRFLDDGRIELDTNVVERSIRPIVLNRKNALFAGHDQGAENWACIASLIESCKLFGIDPQTYFTDVLTKLVNLWPASRIDELMPWAWAAERSTNKLAA